ncbi:general secretion pathway protein GspN [Luteibacter aegosomatis]|uniref:general secretion pathway protein GspN n=1 Tax=Luteibacter aegosomatis TaxID=2911537 RepID=UPI001FF76AC4|nr:general secretion pathway protein GspN [Luteibacter aegosomatis]UPG85401.1 general secretion pathway protein GspN [Luteibacter aegosomatis]
MNAAGQRRLTPVLGGIALALAAVCATFAMGVGRGIQWDDPSPPEPLPQTRAAAMPKPTPITDFAEVWQRPLFMADRKPVAATGGDDSSSNIGDLELTGIIMTSGLRMALLRDTGKDATTPTVRVKEGSALGDGHWTLASLTPRSAVFDNGGERRELTLKVAAPDPLANGPKNGAPMPPGQPQPPSSRPSQMGNGIHIEQHPASSGIAGPVPPQPASAATRQAPPRQDDQALQQARIEALKAAVQRRRIEQQQQQQQNTQSR